MLTSLYLRLRELLNREEGQGMVEYALILVLIAVVVIVVLIILGNPRQARAIVDRDPEWPVKDARRVEDVVDLFVFQQPVGMDPGARHVEARAGERIVGGQRGSKMVAEIGGRPRNRRGIDTRR